MLVLLLRRCILRVLLIELRRVAPFEANFLRRLPDAGWILRSIRALVATVPLPIVLRAVIPPRPVGLRTLVTISPRAFLL